MSKLVIFGDSFAHKVLVKEKIVDYPVWYELLANKLQLSLLHFGLNGSSIEYSITKLYEYINSTEYKETDVIVFVCTSLTRTPIVHNEIPPGIASQWIRFIEGNIDFKRDNNFSHFKQYAEFYKTLYKFFNYDLAHQQRSHVAFLLKSLPNKTIIMSAFGEVDTAFKGSRKSLLKSNGKSLLINSSLYDISTNEFEEGVDYFTFHRFFDGEVRHAHLSKTNNEILADQLYHCMKHASDKYFDKAKFKKNFIKLEINDETKKAFNEEMLSIWKRKFGLK